MKVPFFVLTISFLSIGVVLNAQNNKFELGIEGGPSYIFVHGNEFIEEVHDPTVGFAAGISFQYNFSEHISFRSNLFYERKGSKIAFDFTDINGMKIGSSDAHFNLNYLTVPLLLRFTTGEKVKFFCNAGPYVGYLLKQVTNYKDLSNVICNKEVGTKDFKSLEVGFVFGLGAGIPISDAVILSFELRNNLGLTAVNDYPISDGSLKTNTTNLHVGFAYCF